MHGGIEATVRVLAEASDVEVASNATGVLFHLAKSGEMPMLDEIVDSGAIAHIVGILDSDMKSGKVRHGFHAHLGSTAPQDTTRSCFSGGSVALQFNGIAFTLCWRQVEAAGLIGQLAQDSWLRTRRAALHLVRFKKKPDVVD